MKTGNRHEANLELLYDNTKGHNSIESESKVMVLFSAHCLIKLYSCTKFPEENCTTIKLDQTNSIFLKLCVILRYSVHYHHFFSCE